MNNPIQTTKIQRYRLIGFAAALFLGLSSPMAGAGVILSYDSLLPASGGSATALSRINSQTDTEFVASSAQFSGIGPRGVMAAIHGSQTNVQGAYGDQNDLMFRFGSSDTTPGDGILSGALSVGHVALGPYVSFSYTAAKNQTLSGFSFHLFNNSNNASSYGARDVGLYVQVAGGGYAQFGDLDTSATGNGNQGIVTFSDSLAVANGELVEFRLGFTDRTRTNNDLQAATRIGDVNISAIPEPASLGLVAMVGGGIFFVRRRFMI
ncbi:hypothetical protein PDESU_04257 [Pontiella desulfatans]|uniref:PEP-CTERM protein-sorting domain-containing protein n=1 Tax=Pontiella desulfatans TaxID=2750659 RepID=A0A6C2U6H1_PONDE|nr:PEP-CTERM sorting domain-containing protein [Pontiella desulfatans]VGO15672.1 hypothetical protein PDESU_04257 [Pontiella desulfatans]